MKLLLILALIEASILIDYRFSHNFGQVFMDYSGNANHAVNGDNSSTTVHDTIATDRGAYFAYASGSRIKIPPNDEVSSIFSLGSTFSIVFWALPIGNSQYGALFYRSYDSSHYLQIGRTTSFSLTARMVIAAFDTNTLETFTGSLNSMWIIVRLTVTGLNIKISFGSVYSDIASLTSTYSENLSPFIGFIGTDNLSKSFTGYIWNFLILNEAVYESSYFSYGYSSGPSLVGTGTTSCIFTAISGGNHYCLPVTANPDLNSNNDACPASCINGCYENICLDCTCADKSCVILEGAVTCFCKHNYAVLSECACPHSSYFNSYECVQCASSCTICDKPSVCSTCASAYASVNANGSCKCNSGYYADISLGTNTCQQCHSECATCSQALLCITCKASNATPDNTQGCKCNSGYYGTSLITSTSCHICSAECIACNQTGNCFTCVASNASPAASGGCVCNQGYFGSSLTNANSCSACHSDCQTCSGSLQNQCITCISSNSAPVSGTCVCNSYYYASSSNPLVCTACHSDCQTCSGSQQNQCLSCRDSNTNIISGSCSCLSSYFASGSSPLACSPCHVNCQTCSGSLISQCITCSGSNAALVSGLCQCNVLYYASIAVPLTCSACHMDCHTCAGSLQSECLSCNDPSASPSSGTCTCNNGHFQSASNPLACYSCHADCSSCSGPGDNQCITCLDPNAIIGNSGLCICKAGYSQSGSNPLSCQVCYTSCATCNGLTADNCLTCSDANSAISITHSCVCNPGYYISSLNPFVCSACYSDCLQCSGSLQNECTSCVNSNAEVVSGMCLCSDGYYQISSPPLLCGLCDGTCSSCNGGTINDCLTCFDINAETSNPGPCLCKQSFYLNSGTCISCAENCLDCTGNTNNDCLTCKDANAQVNSTNACECKIGYYPSILTRLECHSCNSLCKTCRGPLRSDCLSCSLPLVTLTVNGTCECPSGEYLLSQNPVACALCSVNCKECNGSSNSNCTLCRDSNSYLSPTNKHCTCNKGYYSADYIPLSCAKCHEDCIECTGALITDCTICKDPNSQASPLGCTCLAGYYNSSSSSSLLQCSPCSSSCLTCSGKSNSQCLSCPSFSYLNQTTCFCITGYYFNGLNCLLCPEPCQTCESESICLSCYSGVNFDAENKTCVCPLSTYYTSKSCHYCGDNCLSCKDSNHCIKCLDGFYSKSGACASCHMSCRTCSGETEMNCSSCIESLILTNNTCICETSFFRNENNACTPCIANCKVCNNSSSCIGCLDGFIYDDLSSSCIEEKKLSLLSDITGKVAQAVTYAASATVFSSILMNNQPSLVWTSLNTAQILCYIPLQNIDIPSTLYAFLLSIQPINFLPNIWVVYTIIDCNGPMMNNKFYDYGYTCTYFIINTGEIVLAFILPFGLLLFFSLLAIFPFKRLKKYCISKIKEFRWKYFLRYWIESFQDVAIPCMISLGSLSTSSQFDTINSTLGFVFAILVFFTPILSMLFIINCHQGIKDHDLDLISRYGSLFEEFKHDKGLASLMFYALFFIRRVIYALILYYCSFSPLLQVSINASSSLILVFYLVKHQPFKETRQNVFNISQEAFICLSFVLSGLFLIDLTQSSKDVLGMVLMGIVGFTIFAGYAYSIVNLLRDIKEKCKKRNQIKISVVKPETMDKVQVEVLNKKGDENVFLRSAEGSINMSGHSKHYVSEAGTPRLFHDSFHIYDISDD